MRMYRRQQAAQLDPMRTLRALMFSATVLSETKPSNRRCAGALGHAEVRGTFAGNGMWLTERRKLAILEQTIVVM